VSRKSRILAVAVTLAVLSGQLAWPVDGGSPPPAATTNSAGTSSEPSENLQEVTVTAHRIELEKRVSKFVNQIAATENGAEGLARWQRSVCPLVSGLPRQDGEFILERLSEIAHVAGVPLADEHCRPNLYILVTDQPEDLLRGMEKRNRAFTFGYDTSFYPPILTRASIVDEFIKTPRAVRVWYSSYEQQASGVPMPYCEIEPGVYIRCGHAIAGGSHLVFSTVWMILRAFVVVDQKRLRDVKLRQLADYIAISGFAELKPGSRLGDAPTILTLFDGAPKSAPAGMTAWDQAFLKSLYATEQRSMLQRSEIAHQMISEISH
jgi:hypothetical protein